MLHLRIPVKNLVEFVLRSGDLGQTGRFVASDRALEGTRGHRRLQKSRPAGYEAEVPVSFKIAEPDFELTISGRIDGLLRDAIPPLIEEIKTTETPWTGPPHPLHLAQAKCYAAIYSIQNQAADMEIQLTYLDLETNLPTEFRELHSGESLRLFFDNVVREYLEWARAQAAWIMRRNQSIRESQFPFAGFREGQRKMAVAVYRALQSRSRLYAEAPTGIGKTISALFPAAKALAELPVARVFYLTAKNAGAAAAEKAAADLAEAGMQLRSISITAKDKICFCRQPGGPPPDAVCPFTIGYYDRIKPAVRELLSRRTMQRETICDVAREFSVCPFELSLDAALWSDLIVGDYNYAFDPTASLKRFFAEESPDSALLIDEAHNLVDRAREMFSADLDAAALEQTRKALRSTLKSCASALDVVLRTWRELFQATEKPAVLEVPPKAVLTGLRRFLSHAEEWLARNQPAAFRDDLLELYFRVHRFLRVAEDWTAAFRVLIDPGARSLRLYCTDPAESLRAVLEKVHSSVFFSATLQPVSYYKTVLGGDLSDNVLELESPFDPENLRVIAADYIGTDYKSRTASRDALADLIARVVQLRRGNYLVFFPSYQYLSDALPLVRAQAPHLDILAQAPQMTPAEREAFLAAFAEGEARIGFALLGGIFGEAIDLVGDRLIGVVIVGVGLPQLCLERDVIREHFDARESAGFDFAYLFPGMNRVLQAVGRVIRSAGDRGLAVLVDRRFRESRYRRLFPLWWQPHFAHTEGEVMQAAQRFWDESGR